MKKYFTVPNLLSASRLFMFPFLLYFAYNENRSFFTWLFIFSLFTDIADGFIARRFNIQTEFGSKLDSWGDLTNYVAVLYGIWQLCWTDFTNHLFGFVLLFSLYFLGTLLMLLKFKKLIGMHLYISKATGYVHVFFVCAWLLFGFNNTIYYIAICIGLYSLIEEIMLTVLLKKPGQNLKSLYWVMRNRKDLLS